VEVRAWRSEGVRSGTQSISRSTARKDKAYALQHHHP
jgi:hypothetical protein